MRHPLTDSACPNCRATLSRALVREIRHYEETRLVEVTCALCEHSFNAVWVDSPAQDPVRHEDVILAATMLAGARRLTDLLSPSDLAIDEAA